MKKVTMDVLITFTFFMFASQMLYTFGKVTVLRGSVLYEKPNRRKLICLSEDDGGALVWNYNLIWKTYSSMAFYDLKFHELNKFNHNEIDCKMNANEGCLESWIKNDWSFTNSVKTPMGPVFDQRWEEFKQYDNLQDTYDYVDLELPTEVKLSFSVRVSHDAQILICNGKNYNKDLCYWIIVGGWGNTKSVIRKCVTGVPQPSQWPPRGSECRNELTSFKHTPLSEYEWRSFTITWNSAIRKITVYDTNKLIMTYTDRKMNSLRSNNNYYMFIRSDTTMLFRFHKYDFLHTTVEGAALTSPVFQFNSKMICVQLLIGLCVGCDAHVVLRDYTNDKVLSMVTAKGSSRSNRVHDLPMWQSVKITTNFPATNYNSYNRVVIQLLPKLNDDSFANPLWAIANIRQCPQNGALRMGAVITDLDYDKQFGQFFWPTCQKLFYDESTVVTPSTYVKPYVIPDDANCPEGKIGPQCLFSCKHDLDSNFDCQETKICYKNGCTCASGFSGDACNKPCESNRYGHGCKKICGSCAYNSEERCNKVTGVCNNGCDNTRGIYIPPLCQMSVDKPNTPTIISTNETTIWAAVSIKWKDEYEGISILYSFVIQEPIQYQQSLNKLFRNMTQLTTYFENLEPGTTYHIGFILTIAGVSTHSDWQVAETMCNPAKNFNIIPEENSITIDWRIDPNQLYSCPANWYYLVVRNMSIFESEIVISTLATSFPYKLQYLPSYTSFIVTIFHKNRTLFSDEIHTLEGIPSKVLDLQSILPANTQLTLIWKPPREPNGKIVRYEVILKVKEYYGCKDLNLSTSDNHIITKSTIEPTITIPDLHPYTSYSAQVIVYNSRHFSTVAETIFDTKHSEMPSEIFSQLKVQDWILSWRPPEDCTTISGPLKAKVKIHGISDTVKYFNVTKQTSYYYLNLDQLYPKLNGVEQYVATVYVVRDVTSKENASAFQKYEFKTPPKAPPKVTNLEVVEINTHQVPDMLHLRWQSPLPPLNGKLRNYGIKLCNAHSENCSVIEIQFNESCDLWDDYICKVVKTPIFSSIIKVFAYNMNVTEPGPPAFVTDDMLRNTISVPDAPGNYTFTVNNNSVVDLKWLHPWKTGDHLKSFRIRIQEIFSNLRERISRSSVNETLEYPVTRYMRNYTERLYLFPSTQYVIYIQAVTVANKSSNTKYVEIRTPSTTIFDGVLNAMVNKSDSTILLNIPSVLNDTQDSMMHIIVKGPNICEQYSEVPENLRMRAGVKKGEIAWQAAEVLTSEFAGGQFKIGDNRTYGNAINCPLESEGLYEIVIIVVEGNSSTKSIMLTKSIRLGEVPPKHYEVWIIPVILFLVVASAAFYLCRRKKHKSTNHLTQDEMAVSQNIENYEQEMTSMILKSK